ncbi:hypothetical protein [Gordonia terrae]
MYQSISEHLGIGFILAAVVATAFLPIGRADDWDFEPVLVDRGVILGATR